MNGLIPTTQSGTQLPIFKSEQNDALHIIGTEISDLKTQFLYALETEIFINSSSISHITQKEGFLVDGLAIASSQGSIAIHDSIFIHINTTGNGGAIYLENEVLS